MKILGSQSVPIWLWDIDEAPMEFDKIKGLSKGKKDIFRDDELGIVSKANETVSGDIMLDKDPLEEVNLVRIDHIKLKISSDGHKFAQDENKSRQRGQDGQETNDIE